MKKKKIINIDTSSDAKAFYQDSNEYIYYRNICKNPFVHSELMKEQNQKCAFCGHTFNSSIPMIHHISYMHECKSQLNTEKKKPNCQLCYESTPHMFKECMSKIALVHPYCNMIIEKIYQDKHPEYTPYTNEYYHIYPYYYYGYHNYGDLTPRPPAST